MAWRIFTVSSWPEALSARPLHGRGARISVMDIVSIALGIVMFAVLFGLIVAIDKI
jgi:hypothetical protein